MEVPPYRRRFESGRGETACIGTSEWRGGLTLRAIHSKKMELSLEPADHDPFPGSFFGLPRRLTAPSGLESAACCKASLFT